MNEYLKPTINTVEISIVICTRNRSASLLTTVASLSGQCPTGESCEVVVVDNGSTDNTAAALHNLSSDLRIVYLYEPIPSKSRSLNRALGAANGRLLVFTDDDVTFSPTWLRGLQVASLKYPDSNILCGPIYPRFPSAKPSWVVACKELHGYFGLFSFPVDEGPLPPDVVPYGANCAMRRSALAKERFCLALGPSEEYGPNLGEDTEFFRRVKGHTASCIYVPSSCVYHEVQEKQLEPEWMHERAFASGRAFVALTKRADLANMVYVEHADAMLDSSSRIRFGVRVNYIYGQLSMEQLLPTDVVGVLKRHVGSLSASSVASVLGCSAAEVFKKKR